MLAIGREYRTDLAAQTRAVGDEIEREQCDRERLEHDRERSNAGFERAPREVFDELAGRPFGIVELVGEVVEVDVRVERVVDPVLDVLDVLGRFVDEVAHLTHDERPDREHEHCEDGEDAEEHRAGCDAPPPTRGARVS